MYFLVYKTTNLINGKTYVGQHQSDTLDFDGYLGSGLLLKQSIKKHGAENFTREILHICGTLEEAKAREKSIVTEEFCLNPLTYNLSVGGQGGHTTAGYTYEQKAAAQEKAHRTKLLNGSYVLSEELRQFKSALMKSVRIQPNNRGLKRTDELKKRMSDIKLSRRGRHITNGIDARCIRHDEPIPDGWWLGRHPDNKKFQSHTEESKRKIADKIRGDVCYNNGTINIKLKEGGIPPDGFVRGMIQKHLDRVWINNGTTNRKQLTTEPIPEGWVRGRFKRETTNDTDI